jgi:1,4-dihydroxy-2-naphthoate octaprenyltransferase
MPVYWFALTRLDKINFKDAVIVFIILHLLVYPASNGYNSYMDRDTGSIGGVKDPLPPTKQLYYVTIIMDVMSVCLGFLITPLFALGIFLYILASKAYSYRKIRLKQYPVTGYLTVVIFQGALTFFLVYHGCQSNHTLTVPVLPMIAASLLIGGFYPLTQIYQHEEDLKDNVRTISYVTGYKGTFIFTLIVYIFAFFVLGLHFVLTDEVKLFLILQIFMLPVIVYFFIWFREVLKNRRAADYKHTMLMNTLASSCTNAGFITILILKLIE